MKYAVVRFGEVFACLVKQMFITLAYKLLFTCRRASRLLWFDSSRYQQSGSKRLNSEESPVQEPIPVLRTTRRYDIARTHKMRWLWVKEILSWPDNAEIKSLNSAQFNLNPYALTLSDTIDMVRFLHWRSSLICDMEEQWTETEPNKRGKSSSASPGYSFGNSWKQTK